VFQAVIDRFPPPPVPENNEAVKLFLFDARFVPTRGVVCLIKVMQGTLSIEQIRQLMSYHNQTRYQVYEYGIVQPNLVPTGVLKTG
jgi:GTP-binding protein LepA